MRCSALNDGTRHARSWFASAKRIPRPWRLRRLCLAHIEGGQRRRFAV